MLILLLFATFSAIKPLWFPWEIFCPNSWVFGTTLIVFTVRIVCWPIRYSCAHKSAHVVATPKWVPLRAPPNLAIGRVLLLFYNPYLEPYLRSFSIYGMGLIFSRASDCRKFPTLINRVSILALNIVSALLFRSQFTGFRCLCNFIATSLNQIVLLSG